MSGYPSMIVPVNHIEPVPRRIRAVAGGRTVVDTLDARYLWEWPNYPQYYLPLADVDTSLLVDESRVMHLPQGDAARHGLRVGDDVRTGAARVFGAEAMDGIQNTVRFMWDAMDAWYEEDEQVFVHPRNPYTRVDAIRSRRRVRIELDGVVLAETGAPVLVFETGLPTRFYIDRTEVDFSHLEHTDTVTECPYKGTTSDYWSIRIGEAVHRDLAWAYDFPTRQLQPITGMVAFYDEKVDVVIDDRLQERPVTHFFP